MRTSAQTMPIQVQPRAGRGGIKDRRAHEPPPEQGCPVVGTWREGGRIEEAVLARGERVMVDGAHAVLPMSAAAEQGHFVNRRPNGALTHF